MEIEGVELTKQDIRRAIEEKRCPYCGSQRFHGQGIYNQSLHFEDDTLYLGDVPTSDLHFWMVLCDRCLMKIPWDIWRQWLRQGVHNHN